MVEVSPFHVDAKRLEISLRGHAPVAGRESYLVSSTRRRLPTGPARNAPDHCLAALLEYSVTRPVALIMADGVAVVAAGRTAVWINGWLPGKPDLLPWLSGNLSLPDTLAALGSWAAPGVSITSGLLLAVFPLFPVFAVLAHWATEILLELVARPMVSPVAWIMKRAIDMIFAGLLLVLAIPVFLAIIAGSRLEGGRFSSPIAASALAGGRSAA